MCSQQTWRRPGGRRTSFTFTQTHLHPGPKSYGHEARRTIYELRMMWSRVSNGMSWTTLVRGDDLGRFAAEVELSQSACSGPVAVPSASGRPPSPSGNSTQVSNHCSWNAVDWIEALLHSPDNATTSLSSTSSLRRTMGYDSGRAPPERVVDAQHVRVDRVPVGRHCSGDVAELSGYTMSEWRG